MAEIPDLTVTVSLDITRFVESITHAHAALLRLMAATMRFTVTCPGCRRETHCLDYDLTAESCRACLEVIPRLQRTVAGAHVVWAPIRPELHWRTPR